MATQGDYHGNVLYNYILCVRGVCVCMYMYVCMSMCVYAGSNIFVGATYICVCVCVCNICVCMSHPLHAITRCHSVSTTHCMHYLEL